MPALSRSALNEARLLKGRNVCLKKSKNAKVIKKTNSKLPKGRTVCLKRARMQKGIKTKPMNEGRSLKGIMLSSKMCNNSSSEGENKQYGQLSVFALQSETK